MCPSNFDVFFNLSQSGLNIALKIKLKMHFDSKAEITDCLKIEEKSTDCTVSVVKLL